MSPEQPQEDIYLRRRRAAFGYDATGTTYTLLKGRRAYYSGARLVEARANGRRFVFVTCGTCEQDVAQIEFRQEVHSAGATVWLNIGTPARADVVQVRRRLEATHRQRSGSTRRAAAMHFGSGPDLNMGPTRAVFTCPGCQDTVPARAEKLGAIVARLVETDAPPVTLKVLRLALAQH